MSVLKPGIALYLVRHGETDWNREARYQGQRDVPLNNTGRAQARAIGRTLKGLVPNILEFDFVASPLMRAIETMRILRTELGLPPDDFRRDAILMELNYGTWEGELAADLELSDPAGVAAKAADPFHWRPKGGESYADLANRVSNWVGTLNQPVIAVAHGGVSRVARGLILRLEEREVPFLDVPQDKALLLADKSMRWL